MKRVMYGLVILLLLSIGWHMASAMKHGARLGDIVAYSVLLVTFCIEGSLWAFMFWYQDHDPQLANLNRMKEARDEAVRARSGRRVQEVAH